MTDVERSPWFYVNLLEPVIVQVQINDLLFIKHKKVILSFVIIIKIYYTLL